MELGILQYIVATTHLDPALPTFTLFIRPPVQKDTVFKTQKLIV